MLGIGTAIIHKGMTIKNKCISVAKTVRDFLVHHRKTWLPYGAILVFLTSLWFLWDGPEKQTQTIRETKNEDRSSSPVFSATEKMASPSGELVYSTASGIRMKPLPDLFARSLPKQETRPQTPPQPVTAAKPASTATVKPHIIWPVVRGTVQSGTKGFVILSSGTETKLCGPGDYIDGFYVLALYEWAVVLSKDGQDKEILLTGGSG